MKSGILHFQFARGVAHAPIDTMMVTAIAEASILKNISLAKDFTKFPAGRFKEDGPFSGELFREKYLAPALEANEIVSIQLDGARGYGSSFLEEAFGGLVRLGFSPDHVLAKLTLISRDESLIREITSYIRESFGTPVRIH